MQFEIHDEDGLGNALSKLAGIKQASKNICLREATEIYNRGMDEGGTPVDTGELRQSLTLQPTFEGDGEVGYVKDYAPHVEYGHRTVNGGYVEGQYYLRQNVKAQEPIYNRHLKEILKGMF